jgi:hypothetical protein
LRSLAFLVAFFLLVVLLPPPPPPTFFWTDSRNRSSVLDAISSGPRIMRILPTTKVSSAIVVVVDG